MYYVTGDIHGDQVLWHSKIDEFLKPNDTLIVTGDFGVGFFDGRYWPEEMFYDHLAGKDYTVLFCDGNHENFDKLYEYDITTWCGGNVHKIRDNVIHLMRGEVYTLADKKLYVMGGGYSLDKYRRIEGYSWWAKEMPDEAQYKNSDINLKDNDYSVDYVITHTAPIKTLEYICRLGERSAKLAYEELPLNNYLQFVADKVKYEKWYFGHLHTDKELWKDQYVIYKVIRELETGNIVSMR